jgi:hypothetical protein
MVGSLAGVVAVDATAAFANAANPNPGTTGSVVVNSDGSVSISLNGTWTWPGQDCAGRYGEGFSVDWWGVSTSPTTSPAFDLTNATEVTGYNTISTGTLSEVGSLAIPGGTYFHVGQFYTGQDVNSSNTCTDTVSGTGAGATVTSSGPWSSAATYPSVSDVPPEICVNVYDEHGGPAGGNNATFSGDTNFNPLTDLVVVRGTTRV